MDEVLGRMGRGLPYFVLSGMSQSSLRKLFKQEELHGCLLAHQTTGMAKAKPMSNKSK
jgi:hypothetical protein